MAEKCNILFLKMNLLVIDLLKVQFKLWSIFSKINTSLALWQPLLHTCVLFFRPTSSILRANRLSTTDYGSELPTSTKWSCLSTSTAVWTSSVISQSQRSSISAIQSQHSKYWTSFSTSQSVSTTEWTRILEKNFNSRWQIINVTKGSWQWHHITVTCMLTGKRVVCYCEKRPQHAMTHIVYPINSTINKLNERMRNPFRNGIP